MVVGYQEHQTLPSQLSYLQKHSFSSRGSRNTQPSCLFLMSTTETAGLEKSAVWLSRTSKFSCRASNFHFHLPKGQRPRKDVCQLNKKKSKFILRLAQGMQNLRAACPKGKLEFKFL